MKRTGFKKKSYDEIIQKKREAAQRAVARQKARPKKVPKKIKKAAKKRKSSPSKGYQAPKWFTKLKAGSHGSNAAQKKYWKVVSDTYREEDWNRYNGRCVSCHKTLEHWKDGDLAHFKRYAVCNSWFKFERKNLALSCKGCNRNDDGIVGHAFGEELKRRWGEDVIEWIEQENLKYRGQKLETWQIVDKVARLRPDLVV